MRNIIHVLSVVLALAANPALAQAGPGPGGVPAPGASGETHWPQSFALQGTNEAQYSFSVGTPGTVTVMVQWQGDPLTTAVTKPNGQKSYSNFRNSQGQMQLAASADDVRRGGAWRLEIYATPMKMAGPGPNPNANHRVNGTASVQVPGPVAAPHAGRVPPPPAPGSSGAPNHPLPPPPPPSRAKDLTQESNQTCFAYSNGSGERVSVQCSWRRDWCEEHVRNKTLPNMVIVLGCSPAPVYCYSYNNGNSGVCFADGNECVNNRNDFASRNGASVGACRAYTGDGIVTR